MLNNIIRFSIQHKRIIGIFTLVLVVWGVWSAARLPIDAVPDITNNQVQIITTAPTLASQEVEQLITYPIEQSIANLPDLDEVRSISRFGLSVITVVFNDDVDVYFARQLINEKLKEAEEQIPEGIGKPELAPLSTGLGQVYEYVIHPKKGSEHKYSSSDLRTIQDWIIARQLYGTPGIAEVNSFGGMLKQYEVSLDPDRLKALNITIPEIVEALENNNQNTGGAYIEKNPNAYFIRGIGLVNSLDDIGKIGIKNSNGIPILIRDVAIVKMGNAIRYGAMTRNGESEVVGGIIMMLKGENSAEVVERVKKKMELIQATLPPDIVIDPYLDRTELVNRAMSTVKTNLIEGALIVIFVLVIFLGNLRAGLIVASAIPLSLLFALGMMNVFGVSANLMSLGAIDFGLIIDGAVIIVEATMHHLALRKTSKKLSQKEMDEEVYISASRIRNSAAFGEIIILIVYIPILTLVGIEGKMFRPMAQTVGFAILGALILSLTYIPMMSALFLSKVVSNKITFSDRMMLFFQRLYKPVLEVAISTKYIFVTVSIVLTVVSILIFSRMGGEFIPQLQEGDYAFHCILPQGASLTQSIETSMHASRIIKGFPEVKEVIGRTGSAEVPTDPMPPEASDLIIVLKDRKEWTTTKDYNKLASLMMEKLEVIPGVFFEANQPIQMRFNELMTGVRQDVAIKLFGENLDTLSALAPAIVNLINSVNGVTDPQVERVTGLPQITVTYDRNRLASYNLNVEDVNNVISTAFAGQKAGVVYENERKFDLVVRLDSTFRTSIEDVANLYVPIQNNAQVPLSQVATVGFKEGPAQISRENARRKLVIGFNVKGRDVRSVVEELQEKIKKVKLPTGYFLSYGGTFENLEAASARLMIAIPVALLLIFALLYFTFHSYRQAGLIFSAIPMAAIGGVFALLIRGMPFSISAGVGFIALFGVAVLNGIVLIATFNQLEREGWTDVIERIKEGTRIRLRPVLMTATVASLGFLPMAISTGAGAEVQKPLATVVIGGLITATILTLLVLPLLYMMFNKSKIKGVIIPKLVSIFVAILFSVGIFAQSPTNISFRAAFDTALKNNLQIKAADLQIQQYKALQGTWAELPKTGIFVENEDITPSDPEGVLKIGVSQGIAWPGYYKAQKTLLLNNTRLIETQKKLKVLDIKRELQQSYYSVWYLQSRKILLYRLDSIYNSLAEAASLRVRTGESPGLDSIAANAKRFETRMELEVLDQEILIQQENIKKVLNTRHDFLPENKYLQKVPILVSDSFLSEHPQLLLQKNRIDIAQAELKLVQQSRKPDFVGRFFSQRLYGLSNPYSGFSVTAEIPIFGGKAFRSRIRAANAASDIQKTLLDYENNALYSNYNKVRLELIREKEQLKYYEDFGLALADGIINSANLAYRGGEINYSELAQFLEQATNIQQDYLEVLDRYNQAAININYYLNR